MKKLFLLLISSLLSIVIVGCDASQLSPITDGNSEFDGLQMSDPDSQAYKSGENYDPQRVYVGEWHSLDTMITTYVLRVTGQIGESDFRKEQRRETAEIIKALYHFQGNNNPLNVSADIALQFQLDLRHYFNKKGVAMFQDEFLQLSQFKVVLLMHLTEPIWTSSAYTEPNDSPSRRSRRHVRPNSIADDGRDLIAELSSVDRSRSKRGFFGAIKKALVFCTTWMITPIAAVPYFVASGDDSNKKAAELIVDAQIEKQKQQFGEIVNTAKSIYEAIKHSDEAIEIVKEIWNGDSGALAEKVANAGMLDDGLLVVVGSALGAGLMDENDITLRPLTPTNGNDHHIPSHRPVSDVPIYDHPIPSHRPVLDIPIYDHIPSYRPSSHRPVSDIPIYRSSKDRPRRSVSHFDKSAISSMQSQSPFGSMQSQSPFGSMQNQSPFGSMQNQSPFGSMQNQSPFGGHRITKRSLSDSDQGLNPLQKINSYLPPQTGLVGAFEVIGLNVSGGLGGFTGKAKGLGANYSIILKIRPGRKEKLKGSNEERIVMRVQIFLHSDIHYDFGSKQVFKKSKMVGEIGAAVSLGRNHGIDIPLIFDKDANKWVAHTDGIDYLEEIIIGGEAGLGLNINNFASKAESMMGETIAQGGATKVSAMLLALQGTPSIGAENGWHFRWDGRNKEKALSALAVNMGASIAGQIVGIVGGALLDIGPTKSIIIGEGVSAVTEGIVLATEMLPGHPLHPDKVGGWVGVTVALDGFFSGTRSTLDSRGAKISSLSPVALPGSTTYGETYNRFFKFGSSGGPEYPKGFKTSTPRAYRNFINRRLVANTKNIKSPFKVGSRGAAVFWFAKGFDVFIDKNLNLPDIAEVPGF